MESQLSKPAHAAEPIASPTRRWLGKTFPPPRPAARHIPFPPPPHSPSRQGESLRVPDQTGWHPKLLLSASGQSRPHPSPSELVRLGPASRTTGSPTAGGGPIESVQRRSSVRSQSRPCVISCGQVCPCSPRAIRRQRPAEAGGRSPPVLPEPRLGTVRCSVHR